MVILRAKNLIFFFFNISGIPPPQNSPNLGDLKFGVWRGILSLQISSNHFSLPLKNLPFPFPLLSSPPLHQTLNSRKVHKNPALL